MAETVPSEKIVTVTPGHLGRLWTLTIASLVLNALILLLIVAGVIIHHHRHKHHHGFGGSGGRDGGCFRGHCQMGGGDRFHHFGGSGWGRQGGFGGHGGGGGFRGGNDGGGHDGNRFGGDGNDNSNSGGFGSGAGQKHGPPDPAKMTDMVMAHLSDKLTLTDDEKTKIKPIVQEQIADIQKQMETQRQAMQKQIEDAKAKIRPLLTSDQQKQFDAMPIPGQKPASTPPSSDQTPPLKQ
jgi:hypothetical protein